MNLLLGTTVRIVSYALFSFFSATNILPTYAETPSLLSTNLFFLLAGHPDFVHIGDKVAQAIGGRSNDDGSGVHDASVVVIGHGNVALDCARILVKGRKGLFDTDLVSSAMDILGDGVADVSIVGRRGHVQGAFTIKEVRELVKLEEQGFGVSFVIQTEELDMGETDSSLLELAAPAGRPKKRINKLLREAASKGKFCDNGLTVDRKQVLKIVNTFLSSLSVFLGKSAE